MANRESEIPMLTERWPSLMRQVVTVHRSSGELSGRIILKDCLNDMNSKDLRGGDLQLFGHYASCILTVFPSLEENFKRAISELGGNVSSTPDYPIPDKYSPPEASIALCQLFLLFFKSTDSLSYANDMNSTIGELKFIAGFHTTKQTDQISLNFDAAVKIRTMLGSSNDLRTSMLSGILKAAKPDNPFGYCCNYAAKKLAWTDMSELVLINDVLLVNKSPVLGDARVASEVQNLHETFNAINKNSHPQFFGINASGCDVNLLDSSRFPLLIKVVKHISKNRSFINNQSVSTPPVNDQIVLQLVAIHKEFMEENKARPIGRLVEFLPL